MGDGFTKLFADIVDSSIWEESAETCKVWVTLLALSDADGFIRGSVGWLAGKAKVSVEDCQQAVDKFLAPDPKSRTRAHEGRRIQNVDRGWVILNYTYFRNEHGKLSNDPRKIYQREWIRKKRLSTGVSTESRQSRQSQRRLNKVDPASEFVSVQSSSLPMVETPDGFPKSEDEAIAIGEPMGIPREFTSRVYNEAVGAGYLDRKGRAIRGFSQYLRSCHLARRDWEEREKLKENHSSGQAGSLPLDYAP